LFAVLCEQLTHDPRIKRACGFIGVDEKTYYRWIWRSLDGDPAFAFFYNGKLTPLHEAVKDARARAGR
jgi:hypothetical protein